MTKGTYYDGFSELKSLSATLLICGQGCGFFRCLFVDFLQLNNVLH